MTRTLFTLGYQKRDLEEFMGLLRAASINVLVDVRETPWSHKPGFSKGALSDALAAADIDYVHAKFAGNPKRLRAEAHTHEECLALYRSFLAQEEMLVVQFDTLIAELHAHGKRVCLTCFERHPDDCHRSILADLWRQRGRRKVEHLATDGAPRFLAV
jgi:uncharacterized protein (DUF488 family)